MPRLEQTALVSESDIVFQRLHIEVSEGFIEIEVGWCALDGGRGRTMGGCDKA